MEHVSARRCGGRFDSFLELKLLLAINCAGTLKYFQQLLHPLKEILVYKERNPSLKKKACYVRHNYSFRHGHSIEQAIPDIVNSIKSNMDAGAFSCGVFIDLKLAFDAADHKLASKTGL